VEQDTLDDIGFSLDLIYMANGLGCDQQDCVRPSAPPEVAQLEEMLQAVLTQAQVE